VLGERPTVRAHFWQSAANYVQQGFGLVLGIVLARLLTPRDFGEYAFALATVSLGLLPVTWSITQVLLADGGRSPGLFAEVMGFGWLVAAAKVSLSLLIAFVFWAGGQPRAAALAALIGGVEGFREIGNVLMVEVQARGEFKHNFHAEALSVALSFLLAVPAALAGWGTYALVLPGFTSLAGYLLVFVRASRKRLWQPIPWRTISGHFRHGFWLWVNNVSQVAFGRMDNWFIGRFQGDQALGLYNRAYNYSPVAMLALNSLVTNPTVAALARAETLAAKRRLLGKTLGILLVAGSANAFAWWFFADPLVVWIFGEPWRPSIPLFRAFAGFSLCGALFWLPVAILFAHRRFHEVALVRGVGALVFLAIFVFFIHSLSLEAVCWLVQGMLLVQALWLWRVGLRVLSGPRAVAA
jgi:O-antigen/teichoic acid export membrane protein